MTALAAASGISTAYALLTPQNRPSVEEGNGPPDHAKAWGWRAKQPAPAEATPPAAETPPAAAAAPAVDALLSGSFGDIKLKLEFESEAGEFKIEVSRDGDGLSVEIKAETDHGEIKISFESGEHGGLKVEFESDELGDFTLSVKNLSESDPATTLELLAEEDDDTETASTQANTSGADMEAVLLGLASATGTAPSASGAMSEYEQMKALFT